MAQAALSNNLHGIDAKEKGDLKLKMSVAPSFAVHTGIMSDPAPTRSELYGMFLAG